MIIPKLWARLGNQAFMIAAAIAHAKKMNTKWAVPSKTIDTRIWPTYFKGLPIKPNISSPFHTYKERRHCFDAIPERSDMWIEGYFQSEKYWPTNDEKYEIGDALGFHCDKKDYIAVHVRRGDYLQYPDQFPILTQDYYTAGIDYFISAGYDNFRVYSDDIEFCKKQFTIYCGLNFSYSNIKEPLTDMRDMYNAAGFIISNSTFSLFPALLRLDQPPTIAPAEHRWFGPANKHLETCDLMPDRFIKI